MSNEADRNEIDRDETDRDDDVIRDDELIVEPDDSIIDDWRVQDVERETADADRALREAGGDADRAEDIFEERRRADRGDEFDVPEEERPV